MRRLIASLALLLVPAASFAAPLDSAAFSAPDVHGARTLVVSEAAPANAYLAGADVTVAAPVAGDLLAAGGSVTVDGPVAQDALLAAGSLEVRKPIAGDLRLFGGRIVTKEAVEGDLVAMGGSVSVGAPAGKAWVAGGQVSLAGANGDVRVYGSDITLSGTYAGSVVVTTSDRLTIAEGTIIRGVLRYDAPSEAVVPASARVDGGVQYAGTSYLPSSAEARTFAIAGLGAFILIRILSALIAAGLAAGLLPAFTALVVERALGRSFGKLCLIALLGFAITVATPMLMLLLVISFAGIGVALVIGAAYALLMLLSYLYAGIIAGAALARQISKRKTVYWRDAVIGMLALYLVSSLPLAGWAILGFLWSAAVGSIVAVTYRAAFGHEDEDLSNL